MTTSEIVVLLITPDASTRIANGLLGYDFAVLLAENTAEAVEQLNSSRQIDVLVTDAEIEGELDGLALARVARQTRPEIDVIYSAPMPYRIPDQAKVAGAPCLRSPYHPHQLASVIRALKPRSSANRLALAA